MRIDRRFVLGAALDIAPRLQKGQLVVLESPTYPGTTRERLAPILESGSGLKAGQDFHLAFSPERVDPGREDWTTQNTPKIVGGLKLDVGGPLTVAALDSGAIDVGLLFSTSSVINANGWVVLEDDKHLQQADNIAPVVREDVVNDEITGLLNAISAALTSDNITDLNKQVEIDKKDAADVAGAFLDEQGLLPDGGDGAGTTITVGVSGAFAENQIVAEMYAQVLEAAGYTVERQLDLASREISDKALQQGDIDIKPEYLGSELLFLDPSAQASGDPAAEAASLAPLLKEKDGAVLLDYSQANDTNSFVVTAETMETAGLVTVVTAKPARDHDFPAAPPPITRVGRRAFRSHDPWLDVRGELDERDRGAGEQQERAHDHHIGTPSPNLLHDRGSRRVGGGRWAGGQRLALRHRRRPCRSHPPTHPQPPLEPVRIQAMRVASRLSRRPPARWRSAGGDLALQAERREHRVVIERPSARARGEHQRRRKTDISTMARARWRPRREFDPPRPDQPSNPRADAWRASRRW
jgi:osmoprotectant transport system substrate-binding protein